MSGNKIRIEDLAEPQLTEAQQGAIAYMEANPVEISEEIVLAAAREQAGSGQAEPTP